MGDSVMEFYYTSKERRGGTPRPLWLQVEEQKVGFF
jgi:hypothetical protein